MHGERLVRLVLLVMACSFVPPAAWGQSATTGAIAGVVRDMTGAVLPGVTVEATSPALIERFRSAVTDAAGQYKIVDLRPGIYTVTFTLTGFSTVNREGIELTTGFTATINADMRVGALEETLTVSGSSPVVDTQNTNQQKVLSRAVLESVPTNNAVQGFAAIIPGAVLTGLTRGVDVGGTMNDTAITFGVHGARGTDLRAMMDGMSIATMTSSGGGTSRTYTYNQAAAEEIVLQTGFVSAEGETGGVLMNMVPRDGGNTFKGVFDANFANGSLQSTNFTDELRTRGLLYTPSVKRIYAVRGGLGGPIIKDKLWFYTSHGRWVGDQEIAGNYYNKTPGGLFYEPDYSKPAEVFYPARENGVRVTWQAGKHKLTGHYSREEICNCFFFADSGAYRPEATVNTVQPSRVSQATWSYPASRRLLFEAGAQLAVMYLNSAPITPSALADRPITDLADGYQYGSRWGGAIPSLTDPPAHGDFSHVDTRFAVSYITGSHALKIGGTTQTGHVASDSAGPNYPEAYVFRNRVPVSLTQIATPISFESRMKMNLGLFAQDQWTMKRLTLSLGVRFATLNTYLPAQVQPAGEYVPETRFNELNNVVNWKDVFPRLGAAYDLFGNGKTALKVSLGHYVIAERIAITQNIAGVNSLVPTATRTWNDINGNYFPDCDLHNSLGNGECGALSNANLGKVVVSRRFADDVTQGWGTRPDNWQGSASVQHELWPGIALNVAYFRTSFGNFMVTDDLARTPADYDPYCVTAPMDARLPTAGTQICGLYDLKPARFSVPANNLVTQASHFGKQTEVSHTVDMTINARFGQGGMFSGGFSAGKTVADACDIATNHPEIVATMTLPTSTFTTGPSSPTQFCRVTQPFASTTQLKVSGSYPLPWWGLQAAGTLQSVPGPSDLASYVASNAQIALSLGRNLGQCGTSATCNGTVVISNLFAPNTQLEGRRNQVDLRLTKFIRRGRLRLRGNLDIYNLLNASSILNLTTRYSPTNSWLQPTGILSARLFKLGMQLDF